MVVVVVGLPGDPVEEAGDELQAGEPQEESEGPPDGRHDGVAVVQDDLAARLHVVVAEVQLHDRCAQGRVV